MGILNAHWSEQPTEQKTGNLPVLIARRSKTFFHDLRNLEKIPIFLECLHAKKIPISFRK
jgi:hypothetical protein